MGTSTGIGGLEANTSRLRDVEYTENNTHAVDGTVAFIHGVIKRNVTIVPDEGQQNIQRAIDFLRPYAERVDEGKQVKLLNGDEVRFHHAAESDEKQM